MSYIVKGAKMPPNCWECPSYEAIGIDRGFCLSVEEDGVCKDVDILPKYDMAKPDWCPLGEVKLEDGTLWITTDELDNVNRVIVEQGIWCKIFYQDAVEVVHGEWIDRGKDKIIRWECSVCGRRDVHIYNYCPNCGADMSKTE